MNLSLNLHLTIYNPGWHSAMFNSRLGLFCLVSECFTHGPSGHYSFLLGPQMHLVLGELVILKKV